MTGVRWVIYLRFNPGGLGRDPRTCISNTVSGDADAAGPGTLLPERSLWRAGAGRPRRRSLAPSRRRAPRHPPRSSVAWRISSVCEETLGTFPTSPPGGTKLSSWPHSAPEAAENQGRGGPWGPMAWVRMQALPVATSDSGKADPPPGDSASPSIKWGHRENPVTEPP